LAFYDKSSYCCELDRILENITIDDCIPVLDVEIEFLRDQQKPLIIIDDANKQQDMSGKTFITYMISANIQQQKFECKHRYSDFESLRAILVQNYPSVAVPPIPEKHSVGNYG
jgi:hypothetical protein